MDLRNKIEGEIAIVSQALRQTPMNAALYLERGKLYYRIGDFGKALNDFTRVTDIVPGHTEASGYAEMINEILDFRYKDIYNP